MDAEPRPQARSPWGVPFWIALLAVTGVALLTTAQSVTFRLIENQPPNPLRVLRSELLFWWSWLLLLPALVALARRRPIDLRRPRTLAFWAAFAVAFVAVHAAVRFLVAVGLGWIAKPVPTPPLWYGVWATFVQGLAPNLVYVAAVLAAWHMIVFWREANARRLEAARMEGRLAALELDLLRIQLEPHFLFNALNTVSALMSTSVDDARAMLAELGALLRLALDALERGRVRVADELDFAERYLAIQQHRYRERLRVAVVRDEEVEDAWVPSLLLQPLVENAVRHGVEARPGGGLVEVAAHAAGGVLRLTVSDDGPGPPPAAGEGVGLRNTRERLRHLYGGRARLELRAREPAGCQAVLEIPLRFTREEDD
ncbi:MAG: sensor histidine kinase [Longimicrobiaceae bacterium]